MHDEQVFRVLLIAGFLAVFPVALYYRLKSQAARERLDRRQEGLFILFTLRPIAAAGVLGLMAYMIDPSWMEWSAVPFPEWLRWTGALLGAMAGGLLVWTLHSLGKNLTDTVVTRREHTLVRSGPYRWVRHPFYDSTALSGLAASLLSANWFVSLTVGFTLVLIVVRTRTEEEKLVERFGDPYRDYIRRTGRFWPRFRRT